jgi:hypothetical protein
MDVNAMAFNDFFVSTFPVTAKEIEVFKIADDMTLSASVMKCANGHIVQEL